MISVFWVDINFRQQNLIRKYLSVKIKKHNFARDMYGKCV